MNNLSSLQIQNLFRKTGLSRGSIFGGILLLALLAFEVFNYSTTDFALTDFLSENLKFAGIRWATILSIAFCGIDFAGIARLFTPEKETAKEPAEVWYLFGAWLLAAAMNAILTWWGVAVAISEHTSLGSSIIGRETLLKVVPVFVAVMVWLIRLLIIGTFSMSGDRLFSMAETRPGSRPTAQSHSDAANRLAPQANGNYKPLTRPMQATNLQNTARPEPTYQPVGMAAKSRDENNTTWR